MSKMMQVEVWVCVNESEEFVTHEDRDTCADRMRDEYTSEQVRMIRVVLSVPVPEAITLTGTVPLEPTTGTMAATSVEN